MQLSWVLVAYLDVMGMGMVCFDIKGKGYRMCFSV